MDTTEIIGSRAEIAPEASRQGGLENVPSLSLATGAASPADMKLADARSTQMRQLIILGVITLALAIAIVSLWRWLYGGATSPPEGEQLVELAPDRGGWARRLGQPQQARAPAPVPRDGVRKSGDNSYSIRSGDTTMYASRPNGKAAWKLSFGYATAKFTSPDQPALLAAKYTSKALGLSDEQLKQLNALPAFGGMTLDASDRARLESLWTAYIDADEKGKPDAEKALVQTLDEVGKKSLEPTRAAINAHVDKIRAILTPEQIAKLVPRR
jgi:hypothetical protein